MLLWFPKISWLLRFCHSYFISPGQYREPEEGRQIRQEEGVFEVQGKAILTKIRH